MFDHPLEIAVSDEHGIMAQVQGVWIRMSSDATSACATQGEHRIGVPYELARIGPQSIVYTDPTTSTIRYLDLESKNSAVLDQVSAPLGIAVLHDGGIAFTSGVTRKVARLDGFDPRDVLDPIVDAIPGRRGNAYRVLVVGNSSIWWDNTWADSIRGSSSTTWAPRLR